MYPLRSIPVAVYTVNNLISNANKNKITSYKEWVRDKDVTISVTYKFFEDNNMDDLLLLFNSCVKRYTQDILQVDLNLKPVGNWITKQTKGDSHFSHKHFNVLLSAITYFKDPFGDISNLVFKNHGLSNVFSDFRGFNFTTKIIDWNIFNNTTYRIKPEENQIIIFPGHLEHASDTTDTGVRYCIGVNYFIDDSLGCDDLKDTITLRC